MLHDTSLSSVAPLPTVVLLPCFATFAGLSTLHYWWLNFQGDQDTCSKLNIIFAKSSATAHSRNWMPRCEHTLLYLTEALIIEHRAPK